MRGAEELRSISVKMDKSVTSHSKSGQFALDGRPVSADIWTLSGMKKSAIQYTIDFNHKIILSAIKCPFKTFLGYNMDAIAHV
jgi:hypothetical protein